MERAGVGAENLTISLGPVHHRRRERIAAIIRAVGFLLPLVFCLVCTLLATFMAIEVSGRLLYAALVSGGVLFGLGVLAGEDSLFRKTLVLSIGMALYIVEILILALCTVLLLGPPPQ